VSASPRLACGGKAGTQHFNGCIVVPLWECEPHGQTGKIASFYGRRIGKGTINHLYPPGPHRGLLNPEAFAVGGNHPVRGRA